jgi:dTDP-4-dehydrorhamnose 3,5-epimerase
MIFEETSISGCYVITPDRFHDDRGFFQEFFQYEKYCNGLKLPDLKWEQTNWSSSKKNVLRGIHVAKYAKLVSCVSGKIWDFVVDFRNGSHSYLKHFGIELDSNSGKQIYVPDGCGHGFVSLENNSNVVYLQTKMFEKSGEVSVYYKDAGLGIKYPGKNHIVSDRDKNAISLEHYLNLHF